MKKILKIEIECGVASCASKPGEFCPNLMFKKFGSIPICGVFIDPATQTSQELEEMKGWTMRCTQCLEAEVKDVPKPMKKAKKRA